MNRRLIVPVFLLLLILSGCSKTPSGNSNETDKAVNKAEETKVDDANTEAVKEEAAETEALVTESPIPDVAIEWQDERFEAVIRELLDKPEGNIMTSDLTHITELDLSYAGISNTYDLAYFTNLKEVDFSHNIIDYFGFPNDVKLNNLVKLDLSNNDIQSINCSNLPNLQYLNLQNNSLKNSINGLADNTKLTYLNLNKAIAKSGSAMYSFDDLSAISGLTELTYLDLGYMSHLQDYNCISTLTKLQELNLENSFFTDLELFHIEGFKQLTKLNLFNDNQVAESNFSKIGALTNLISLTINRVDEEDLMLITNNLTNLEELTLYMDSEFDDVSGLQNLRKLKKLSIHDAKIEDPSFLTKLPNLISLDLSDSRVNGTEYLKDMTQLEELSFEPDIFERYPDSIPTDISKLTKLRSLSVIVDSSSEFHLSQLKGMQNLTKLSLDLDSDTVGLSELESYPQITELSVNCYDGLESFDFLSGVPQLTKLSLTCVKPKSKDYSSIKELTNLTELTFMDSELGSSNILEFLPGLTKIESLTLLTTIDQLDFLKNYTDLKTLILASPSTNPVKVDVLAELPKLQTLDIRNITLDDVSILANSQSLRTITYSIIVGRFPVNLDALEQAAPYIDYIETAYN